MKLAKYLLIY